MGGSVRSQKEGALGLVIFDHPERRNAISAEMWEQIPDAVAPLADDPEVRVVIVRGAGDVAFVAGADISEFESRRAGGDGAADYDRRSAEGFAALANLDKPLIALIRGFCVGGGVAIALCADLRYASDDARFAIPAGRLGLGYSPALLEPLLRLVGASRAQEILFTARRYSAQEALAMGLVNGVVPTDEIEAHVRGIAEDIARNAPLTLRSVKFAARELSRDPDARDMKRVRDAVRACYDSDDYKEGVRAFLEKRTPEFKGR